MCLKVMGARKNWAMSPLYASVFFGACFFQVPYIMATYFHVQRLMRESGVVAELILGKRIVSKSSLSLHTQNFKLKKKLFQISFLNSFINAIFAWKLWVRERTQLHERWDMWGERNQIHVLLVYPILSYPHFIPKKLLCKLQAKFLASQNSFHMIWGLRWDWDVCCPSFTVNGRLSATTLF